MTFMRWLLKEAIWFTIIVVIFYYAGWLKTQSNLIALGMGYFTMAMLIFVIKSSKDKDE